MLHFQDLSKKLQTYNQHLSVIEFSDKKKKKKKRKKFHSLQFQSRQTSEKKN
jgi:hypothetical protein